MRSLSKLSLVRSLVYLAAVLSSQAVLVADDAPIRGKLPPEGSWVKYEFTAEDLQQKERLAGNVKLEFVIKTLGSQMRDNEKCRWFEVELKPTVKNVNPAHIDLASWLKFDSAVVKVLVNEAGVRQSDQQVKIFEVIGRIDDQPPVRTAELPEYLQLMLGIFIQSFSLLDDGLLKADPLPKPLLPHLLRVHSVQAAGFDNSLEQTFGQLPPAALGIRSREQRQIATPKGMRDGYLVKVSVGGHEVNGHKLEFELVPDNPIGTQSIKFVLQFWESVLNPKSPLVDLAKFELKAVDFGEGATSILPDIPEARNNSNGRADNCRPS